VIVRYGVYTWHPICSDVQGFTSKYEYGINGACKGYGKKQTWPIWCGLMPSGRVMLLTYLFFFINFDEAGLLEQIVRHGGSR